MTVELVVELVELFLFGAGSLGLSVAALYAERFALATLQSGDGVLAGWAAVVGLVLLGFSYVLGSDYLAPALAEVRARFDDAA